MSIKSWDPIWENVFSSQEWGKYPGESLIRFVAKNFYKKNRKETRLLELGCGPGANIWYIAREGFSAYGIDGSASAIEIAKKRLSVENLEASLRVGDVIDLPYEDNFFDSIIDNECLYCNNIENSSKILSEVKRVLKPGGLFYSRTFSSDMFVGNKKNDLFEFQNVEDGPLAGKGFIRLSDSESIMSLYGKYFSIKSLDKEQYTLNNGQMLISEWTVICGKDN